MIERRDYDDRYAEEILTWCKDELTFYKWTAGTLGNYPLSKENFSKVRELFPSLIFDDSEPVGFFTLRQIDLEKGEMRIGYILIDPEKRGRGYGKALLREGLRYAKEVFGAKKLSLGVFDNNDNARACYQAVGFRDVPQDAGERCQILGEEWIYRKMEIDLEKEF
ncbi:MAG: GNAT family N-acetyltransferase [Bacillota bacterium]|nr:GNAT family N-acetyltransferase [Bacillota bacterium]